MKRPDFFIVGAPRSGTTALASYLGQHPGIFMPSMQDIYFFGSDLPWFYNRSMAEDRYLLYFAGARQQQRIGEASRWYLYSKCAAVEIKRFQPEARIIIMLRNPVDMMYSLHGHRLLFGAEDIEDFGKALEAESERKRTGQVPRHLGMKESVFYREVVRYVPQVERYFNAFGRKHVHIILFDDFVIDTARVYRETLQFLGVSPEFQPEFPVLNAYRRVRSPLLTRLLSRPPSFVLRLLARLAPRLIQQKAFLGLTNMLAKPVARPAMDVLLRQQLTTEFRPAVERLGALIGRDLSSWSRNG